MVLLFNYLGLWKLKKFHTIKSTARHTYVVYIYIYIFYININIYVLKFQIIFQILNTVFIIVLNFNHHIYTSQ